MCWSRNSFAIPDLQKFQRATADNAFAPKSEIFIKREQFKPDHKARNLIFNSNSRYVAIFTPISQVY
jgi:hypothetical protein